MKLRTGWALVLMVILVVLSIGFGAYRGWSQERAKVEETYAGLESMLRTRVESAYNVLAVAGRHLSADDPSLQAVASLRDALETAGNPLAVKANSNERLSSTVTELLSHLAALDSVQRDSRDKWYVESYLPQMMEQSEEKTAGANYNSAAREFNQKLNSTFSGFLAKLMGIRPAEEFLPGKEG
jgi:hypothetical protein